MVLKKKITASSIAEVVIALAVIAMCFTVGSLVFIRSINGTMKFNDFKEQTRIQSELMQKMLDDERSLDFEMGDSVMDSVNIYEFSAPDNKIIWRQEWLSEQK